MVRMMLALAIVLGASGCGGSKDDKFELVLRDLDRFKTRMCACADQACVDQVSGELRTYRKGMRERLDKGAKPTAAQDARGKQIDKATRDCRGKHDATPERDPAADGPTGAGSAVDDVPIGSAGAAQGPGKQ